MQVIKLKVSTDGMQESQREAHPAQSILKCKHETQEPRLNDTPRIVSEAGEFIYTNTSNMKFSLITRKSLHLITLSKKCTINVKKHALLSQNHDDHDDLLSPSLNNTIKIKSIPQLNWSNETCRNWLCMLTTFEFSMYANEPLMGAFIDKFEGDARLLWKMTGWEWSEVYGYAYGWCNVKWLMGVVSGLGEEGEGLGELRRLKSPAWECVALLEGWDMRRKGRRREV